MVCNRRNGLQVKVKNATVPHKAVAPRQVHNGWAFACAKPVEYSVAYAVAAMRKSRCLYMATAAAYSVVGRKDGVLKQLSPQFKTGLRYRIGVKMIYRCRKIGRLLKPFKIAGDILIAGNNACNKNNYYYNMFTVHAG